MYPGMVFSGYDSMLLLLEPVFALLVRGLERYAPIKVPWLPACTTR